MLEIQTGIFNITENDGSIYIIGDIHGDYQCLIHCLVDLCKVANISIIKDDNEFDTTNREYLKWNSNNNSIVIFCGDLIHRKRFQDSVLDDECSDIFIINTILKLKKEAKSNGGDIIIISGNHEIMNIIDPNEQMYTSNKNISSNKKYFNNTKFINNFINNSYAWIKINDILIAHGGLCSDYLKYLDNFNDNKKNKLSGNDIIKFINNKYREYFNNFDVNNVNKDKIAFKLFVEYDFTNKHKHNLFWCREWGYNEIDCDKFKKILEKVNCNKMIIAHCPQFLSQDKPKMINFECLSDKSNEYYNLARVDLGMSRSFEYNKPNNFMKYLSYNYNRKMSVLKLLFEPEKNNLYFNYNSIITEKLSCIQYLLIKYGITEQEWKDKKINSDWIGFNFINELLKMNKIKFDKILKNCQTDDIDTTNTLICLLYPIFFKNNDLDSVVQFNKLI